MPAITHDPQAVLDYTWPWSKWGLEAGETIVTATVAPVAGLTISATAIDGAGNVSVWISGGTAGTKYKIPCHIVTSAGREDDRTLVLYCDNQ